MRSGKPSALVINSAMACKLTLHRSGARPRGKCERTHNLKARQATPHVATSRLGPPFQARIRCQLWPSLPLNSSCADPRPTHLVRACQDSAPSVHCRATAQPPAAGPVCTGCSSQQELQKYFDVEGLSPYVSTGRLRFDALASKHVTPNGHGWRNELTIKKSLRTAFNKTYERLTAKVSVNLSKGSKTIISQFQAADTGTLVKFYVSDTSESGFSNSISTDGIFDVYVRMKNESGKEQKFSLGSVKSGGSFSLDIVNNYGDVTVSALGTSAYLRVKNDPGAFFKFGNYLQAQDPDTMDQVENSSMFGDFYRKNNITTSIVEFTNLTYVRTK